VISLEPHPCQAVCGEERFRIWQRRLKQSGIQPISDVVDGWHGSSRLIDYCTIERASFYNGHSFVIVDFNRLREKLRIRGFDLQPKLKKRY